MPARRAQDRTVRNPDDQVIEFAEKPSVDYARANLRVDNLADDEYLTIFGLYVLSPSVLEILREHITGNLRRKGEFDLTAALDVMRAEEGFLGYVVDGRPVRHRRAPGVPGEPAEISGHLTRIIHEAAIC